MEMLSTRGAEEHQQKLRAETGGLFAAVSWCFLSLPVWDWQCEGATVSLLGMGKERDGSISDELKPSGNDFMKEGACPGDGSAGNPGSRDRDPPTIIRDQRALRPPHNCTQLTRW